MKKISLYTVEEREAVGLTPNLYDSRATVARTSVRQSRRPVGESLRMIQDFVAVNDGVTRLEIADHLERKESPGLRQMIEHLVDVGILEKMCERHEGITGFRYVYRLAE